MFVHCSSFTVEGMKNENTREIILKAAFARFGYYGFSKTTMAEIARDCGMSAANIYRHFSGKNDIIAELASRIFSDQEKKLARIVAAPHPSCSEKIQILFQEALILTHTYITEQPRMKEMVDYICQERFDLVCAHKETKRRLIETVLKQGQETGEFKFDDAGALSLAFKHATVMFHTPLYIEMNSLEDLKISCKNVVALLLKSISAN